MSKPGVKPPRVKCGQPALGWFSTDLIEILPAAVYVCDADAVVISYNQRATELWGRAPKLGDTDLKYCGAHKLFRPDGTFLPHRETPMEMVLRTGTPARDHEVVIERPDGSRVTVLVNIAPIMNGRRLAEIARQHHPALKVLFVTGHSEDTALRGERPAPGIELLTKPVTYTALIKKIQTLLAG